MNDLTDEQISEHFHATVNMLDFARAVIAADRAAQQERKPHTEAEVQRIIFCAYETFGRKGFEDVVRETLGVPAP